MSDRVDQNSGFESGENAGESIDRQSAEEDRLRSLLGTLRADLRAPAELRGEVIARISASRPSRWLRIRDWLLRPRLVPVSPAGAALAFGVLSAIAIWVARDPGTAPGALAEGSGDVMTRFVFVAPEAASVSLTGDFLEWSPDGIALDELRGSGIWTTDVPLPPGVYQYTFVIDGREWVPDPRAVSQVADGFGDRNSVLIVAPDGEV